MITEPYHSGECDSRFGPVRWTFVDERTITFRNLDDAVEINGVLHTFVSTTKQVKGPEEDDYWSHSYGDSHLTRVLSRKDATNNAQAALATEMARLASVIATDENRQQEEICRIRREIAEAEEEITECTNTIERLMADRGRLASRLQMLLQAQGRKVRPV